MELDSDRIKKWDVAADSMIEVKVIVSRMEPHLAELNGTVADLKGQQLVLKGMVAATMGIVTIAGTVSGIVAVIIRF